MDDIEEDFIEDEQFSEGKYEDEDGHSGLEEDDLLEFQPSTQKMKRTSSFVVLPQQKIVEESNKMIQEVMGVCNLKTSAAASSLLRAFKWNKENLLDAYLENPEKACERAGLSSLEFDQPKSDSDSKTFDCLICLEQLERVLRDKN